MIHSAEPLWTVGPWFDKEWQPGEIELTSVHALLAHDENDIDEVVEKTGLNIFITTFLLILVAEFGDKTQIAVASVASSLSPVDIWLGATTALLSI